MDKVKGTFRRGVQTFKEKLGKSVATVDEEYEEVHDRWQQLEKASADSLLHINKLIENCHATATTIQFFAEDLKLAYAKDTAAASAITMLTSVGQEIETNAVFPFQNDIHASVREQLSTYCVRFSSLKELLEERKKLLLEYDYRKDKVHELAEKKVSNPLELPKAKEKMNHARDDYDTVNEKVKSEMVDTINMYYEIYDPMITEVSRLLIEYFQNMVTIISKLKQMPKVRRTQPAYIRTQREVAEAAQPAAAPATSSGSGPRTLPPPAVPAASSEPTPPQFNFEWYYLDATNSQLGPVLYPQLKKLYKVGQVSDSTHVFGGEMGSWTQISAISGLKSALSR